MEFNEYDDGRIWYQKKGKTITVGVTQSALLEMGALQGISLPVEDDEVSQDDVVGELEGDQQTFELIAPFSGTIAAVNEALEEHYDLIEKDPQDEGWIFKMKIVDPDVELENDEEDGDDA